MKRNRTPRAAWALTGIDHRNLFEYSRPCATCGAPFSIFVTRRIAIGEASTHNFALVNCTLHRLRRGKKKFLYPWQIAVDTP